MKSVDLPMARVNWRVTILSPLLSGIGWGPITHLVSLACKLLGGSSYVVERTKSPGALLRFLKISFFPTSGSLDHMILSFASRPSDIIWIISNKIFHEKCSIRVLWIVDSFWTDNISRWMLAPFDLVVYMQKNEALFYERMAPGRALFVGWGADVLDLGSSNPRRSIDILRVGRQPAAWADDTRTALVAESHGLVFHGRPPSTLSYSALMEYYRCARVVVAFSNTVAPASYTHPTKPYFTGRWTDAIANGAVVAGIAPRGDIGISEILWEEALLEFDTIDLQANMEQIRYYIMKWNPHIPIINYVNALLKLDWRLRLKEMTKYIGISFPQLDREIERLEFVSKRKSHWLV